MPCEDWEPAIEDVPTCQAGPGWLTIVMDAVAVAARRLAAAAPSTHGPRPHATLSIEVRVDDAATVTVVCGSERHRVDATMTPEGNP